MYLVFHYVISMKYKPKFYAMNNQKAAVMKLSIERLNELSVGDSIWGKLFSDLFELEMCYCKQFANE